MNDFDYEVRQRKALVPSARRRVNGSRSKGCTLPSDRLTEGAKRKLNGEVTTINMNKPCEFGDLKKLSVETQRAYIEMLQTRFNASNAMIGKALGGAGYATVKAYLDSLGMARSLHSPRPSAEQYMAFDKFMRADEETEGVSDVKEQEVERAPAKAERIVELDDDQFDMLDINFHIDGQAFAVCKKLISMIGADAYGTFNITFYPIKKGGEG